MCYKFRTSSIIPVAVLIIIHCSLLITEAQWIQVSTINTAQLKSVKFFDQDTGVAVGSDGIWRTSDGGYNWTHVLASSQLNSITFYDGINGMAAGDSGKIFKTTDKGLTWQQLISGTTNNLNSIASTNPSYDVTIYFAYIVGQNGIFLRSFNAGSTWSIGTAYTQDLYFIWIMNPGTGTGFTVGASVNEFFSSTANGGTNWLPILNTNNGYHLYSGAFLTGQNTCICVGSGGRIRRTTNWGLTWTFPVSNTTYDLYSVTFVNGYTGWLCGQYGFIEYTTNSGLNWSQQFAPNYNPLRSISFINNMTGWIVGDNGVVLRTNTGGISGIKVQNSEIPKVFKLFQNYPNPFNPTTKIRFDVPPVETIHELSLRIYDILGREITTLVNQQLKPGTYEVEWDASSYPSGVYFYKLQTESFSETKKMILLK